MKKIIGYTTVAAMLAGCGPAAPSVAPPAAQNVQGVAFWGDNRVFEEVYGAGA